MDKLLYIKIANYFEHRIRRNVLRTGEKMPSLRSVCKEWNVSLNTAINAYHALEKKGIITARFKSGYYVSFVSARNVNIPIASQPNIVKLDNDIQETFEAYYTNVTKADVILSSGECSLDLLPVAKLNKEISRAARNLNGSGVAYNRLANEKLMNQIIHRSLLSRPLLNVVDIVLTSGSMESIAVIMQSLLKPGDTIAVESPIWYYVLHLVKTMKLNVIELPTHPISGIDITYLRNVINEYEIKMCFVMGNFGNPFGTNMPLENKRELVELMDNNNIPLIEDDIYGDLYFGGEKPMSCKSFDKNGSVIYCSSFSKTLAAGYRVAWMEPGKYKDIILKAFPFLYLNCNPLTHEAVGNFIESGRYDKHLRDLRQILYRNSLLFVKAINAFFPEDTKVSKPDGGMQLWVELDKRIDTIDLCNKTMRFNISMCPGRIFSLQNQFNNCLRLNFGVVWNKKIEDALKLLGDLSKGK